MNYQYCKYLKSKINGKLECKKQKRIINIKECNGCKYREIKNKNCTIKKKTYKQNKLEKERFSIIFENLSICCVPDCKSTYHVSKNEVYEGAKRGISIKYGFVCPFCEKHHTQFHNDRNFALYYKKLFQKEFEKSHTRDEFINIIHRNYIDDS